MAYAVYMGRPPKPRGVPPPPPLVWRRTRIRDWRKKRDLTQQEVADRLTARGIELTRESVQRIETGNQRPLITALEAMAEILGTDVTSMLNCDPDAANDIAAFSRLDPQTRRLLLRFAQSDDTPGE